MLKNESDDQQLSLRDSKRLQREKNNPVYKRSYELVCELIPRSRNSKTLTVKVAKQLWSEGHVQTNGKPYSKNSILGIAGWYRNANQLPEFPSYQGRKAKKKRSTRKKQSRTTELVTKAAKQAEPLTEKPSQIQSQTIVFKTVQDNYQEIAQRLIGDTLTPADKLTILELLWPQK